MQAPALIRKILESTADIVDALAGEGPMIAEPEAGGAGKLVALGRVVATGLRSLAKVVGEGDRDKLLATLRALRDDGVKPIDQAELDQQVRDVSEAAARRP